MKTIIKVLIVITVFCFSTAAMAQEKKTVYTCPMHPKVQMDKPGNCPICGMELVKKTITLPKAKPSIPKKPATPNKPAAKDSAATHPHAHQDSAASKTHTHQLDDSTIIIHDEHHNEIKDTAHASHTHPIATDTMPPQHQDTNGNADHMDHAMHHSMSHVYSLNLPMNRNGSGTGWLPDASPMYGYMFHTPKWMYMLHGNFFLRYNNQDVTNKGSRGGSEADAPDWFMFMGQRQVGTNGLFHFSTMFSLDAPLGGGSGYPLLFQSGEAYKGKAIVDRQHPHDLFSELSVSYAQALSQNADVFVYVGYPGEPALGPVAFMHRPSALANPDAPITHHWVDATHITFGVATVGIRVGQFKLEGSSFTGREPDENRYDFDKPRFDSWSGRLSFNPSSNWAMQVSHGFIKSPESLHPVEDVDRTTASVIYSKNAGNNSTLNATAVWGVNKTAGHDGENAVLAELEWRKNRLALYTRYEWVQKGIEELSLDENVYGHDAVFPVNAFTAGFNYDLLNIGQTRLAGGSHVTFYHADKRLDPLYGKNPMAVEVYLRLYPSLMMRGK